MYYTTSGVPYNTGSISLIAIKNVTDLHYTFLHSQELFNQENMNKCCLRGTNRNWMGKLPQRMNSTEIRKAPSTKTKTRHDRSFQKVNDIINMEALPSIM
jgi:hypothetical protein